MIWKMCIINILALSSAQNISSLSMWTKTRYTLENDCTVHHESTKNKSFPQFNSCVFTHVCEYIVTNSDITEEWHVWHQGSLSVTNVDAVLTCQSWLLVPAWQIRCCSSNYQRWMFAWKRRRGNCALNYYRHKLLHIQMINRGKRDLHNLLAGRLWF